MKGNLKEFGKQYQDSTSPPFRSIIRGPFESKHGASISENAIQRLKNYLVSDPLNNRIPEKYWRMSLENYVKNNLYIIENEKNRVSSQTSWSNDFNSGDFFNRASSFSEYSWQANVKVDAVDVAMQVAKPRIVVDGYTIVGPLKTENHLQGSAGRTYYKLGEAGEFRDYMNEYDSFGDGSDKTVFNPETEEDEYFTTEYKNSPYDHKGILEDIKVQLTQLWELRYDLRNLDDVLTKNWLYFKTNTLYYNEILVNNTMMDTGLTFRIDEPPKYPAGSNSSASHDLIVFEHWKTRKDEKIDQSQEIRPNKETLQEKGIEYGFGAMSRPIPVNYVFQKHILIYEKKGKVHGDRNPRIVSGFDYTFSSKPGQPNENQGSNGMVTMRARFECRIPARGSTVYFLDSTQIQPDYEINKTVSTVLPVVCDRRITHYDNNYGTQNQVVIDYNKYISKEFLDDKS